MSQALLPVSRGYLLAGALVATGLYLVRTDTKPAAPPAPIVRAVEPARAEVPRPMPTLEMPAPILDDEQDADNDIDADDETEEVRGHAEITDPAEFAMVFEVDGTSYLRLSSEVHAKSHGKRTMVTDGYTHAVIAPVAASALPEQFTKWKGREVLVNGTCRARAVGFAEVSRAAGEAPGMQNYWYLPMEDRPEHEPEWTIDDVVERGVTLAAKLDGCEGTWARSTEYEPAQIADATSSPLFEGEAIANLLAKEEGDLDPTQSQWKDEGGEGDWRDHVEVTATSYKHPATGETWIFVSAYHAGGCGEAGVEKMAAYRVGANGKLHRFTDLTFAGSTIQEVVDLDGDGQPELVLGDGGANQLVDLNNTQHDRISVPYNYYGCGC